MTFYKLDQVQDFSSAWLSTYKETSQGSLERFLQSEVNAGGSKLWFCTLCSMAIFSPLPICHFPKIQVEKYSTASTRARHLISLPLLSSSHICDFCS